MDDIVIRRLFRHSEIIVTQGNKFVSFTHTYNYCFIIILRLMTVVADPLSQRSEYN
jgi:hypothetical protein